MQSASGFVLLSLEETQLLLLFVQAEGDLLEHLVLVDGGQAAAGKHGLALAAVAVDRIYCYDHLLFLFIYLVE